jgi:hypothetical protein
MSTLKIQKTSWFIRALIDNLYKCTNNKVHTNLWKNAFRLITPWSRFILDKLMITHLVKKCTVFYWIRRFITVFPTACFWSLSWARWIHSTTSHPISLRYFHLWLGLPRGLVLSGYLSKISYAILISPLCVTTSRQLYAQIFDRHKVLDLINILFIISRNLSRKAFSMNMTTVDNGGTIFSAATYRQNKRHFTTSNWCVLLSIDTICYPNLTQHHSDVIG